MTSLGPVVLWIRIHTIHIISLHLGPYTNAVGPDPDPFQIIRIISLYPDPYQK